MEYTNQQVAASQDLWEQFYHTGKSTYFLDITYDQRLAILNKKFPEYNADK